jgi:tRNA threonylcarbamoyladenosine biosynthesis protein TsaB
MAAAKGLCYPFKLPLITIGTLHAMAQWGIDNYQEAALICPMIDARRQEVFTAIFDRQLNEIMSPQPMVLKADSFAEFLHSEHSMLFLGNGAEKWAKLSPGKLILNNKNLLILEAMAKIAHVKTENKDFADLFYATPAYLKDFYNPGC